MLITAFIIIWFLSGFLTGVTSFGGNLFGVPLIALFMPMRDAILVGIPTGAAMGCLLVFHYRKHVPWKVAIIVTLASFMGVPLGAQFLKMAGQRTLLLGSALMIFLFLAWQIASKRLSQKKRESPMWLALTMAILSGIMNSGVGMGGPPVALLAYMNKYSKEQAIGFISLSGSASLFGALIVQIYMGMYDATLAKYSLLSAGTALVGIGLSFPLVKYMPDKIFRILLLGMLVFSAFMLVYRAF